MRILITGGTGFIGSHLVNFFSKDHEVVILDRGQYIGDPDRVLSECRIIHHDLTIPLESNTKTVYKLGTFDYIFHLAASSHVDRSITNPRSFVMDNVLGTCNLLEWYRLYSPKARLIYFSTDEVFGPASGPYNEPQTSYLNYEYYLREYENYPEWARYNSTNPYSASKAGAEELCLAYANTYNLDILITHCMNVFGERQHAEKFIPMCITKIMNDEVISIHSSKAGISGTRFYIHALRVAETIQYLMINGVKREKYNIVGNVEKANDELAKDIGKILGIEPKLKHVDFHSSRPGHDLRYALDGSKLKNMGYEHQSTFEADLEQTVKWFSNEIFYGTKR